MASAAIINKINDPAVNNDIIRFKIGEYETPRVLAGYVSSDNNIYTNVNTTQDGRTSQDFVRCQLVIKNVSFDFMTLDQYHDMCKAMKVGRDDDGVPYGGGGFAMTFFNPQAKKYMTRTFIVKELPATIKCIAGDGNPVSGAVNIKSVRVQVSNITFQEV